MEPILKVSGLSVDLRTAQGPLPIVEGVSIEVHPNELVCLVGESGSGKTITSLSIMRLIEYEKGRIRSGEIILTGEDLAALPQKEVRKRRGPKMAMVFQDPMNALNPVFTIGSQLIDVICTHDRTKKRSAAWEHAVQLLEQVGIPEPETRMRQYPYEFSGGMLQRVSIAISLACGPDLLIADEPSTALDVTIQAQILSLLAEQKERMKMAILLITHDMGVAAEMADRLVVMYAGKVVEQGPARQLLTAPQHPYTQGLLQSIASYESGSGRLYAIPGTIPPLTSLPSGCRFHPRCPSATAQCRASEPPLLELNGGEAACWHPISHSTELWQDVQERAADEAERVELAAISSTADDAASGESPPLIEANHLSKHYTVHSFTSFKALFRPKALKVRAVDDVTLSIRHNESFGLVGESGSGKSTLGRLLLQLVKPTSGSIRLQNKELLSLSNQQLREVRKDMQVVFQDAGGSLNPRWTIGRIIGEPLQIQKKASGTARQELVKEAMTQVGLNPEWISKYPHECSGGQRQRIALARAIILKPKFIVLDEAVSALDISVQAQILNLLRELQQKFGLTYLFIAHGLDAVRFLCDRIGVMYLGKLVEIAATDRLFKQPAHPYTRALLDSKPSMNPNHSKERVLVHGDFPSPLNLPSGCRFHTRCPAATEKCRSEAPELIELASGHAVACHHPLVEPN